MRLRAIEQLGRTTQRNEIVEKLNRQGLSRRLGAEAWVGIVEKPGGDGLSTYAEMVVRTKLQQARIEGVRVESLERGINLFLRKSEKVNRVF